MRVTLTCPDLVQRLPDAIALPHTRPKTSMRLAPTWHTMASAVPKTSLDPAWDPVSGRTIPPRISRWTPANSTRNTRHFENLLTASRVQGMLRTADTLTSHVELMARPGDPQGDCRPIFVTGNYRSGSTMLERILSHHSDLESLRTSPHLSARRPSRARCTRANPDFSRAMVAPHHPNMVIHADWPEEAELVWRLCANNPWSNSPCNVLDAGYSDPAFERVFIGTINKQLFLPTGRPVPQQKPAQHDPGRLFLAQLFPSAQFVHIVRHPYRMLRPQLDMVAILERLLPITGLDYGEMFRSLHMRPAKTFARTPDEARIRAALAHNGDLAAALSIADVERMRDSMVEADDLGPRVLVIRYEDLMADFAQEMRRVFEFVGLGGEASEAIIADCDRGFVDRSLISAKTPLPAGERGGARCAG